MSHRRLLPGLRANTGRSPDRRKRLAAPVRTLLFTAIGAFALATSTGRADTDNGPATEAQLEDLANFPRASLEIRTHTGKRVFDIWIADTPARSEQGLMFVRDLPAAQGMLFIESRPRVMSMWMKNTFIALDMLFIRADGTIAAVFARTTPHSLATISTPQSVNAVLELKGGEAERQNVRVGDRVIYPGLGVAAKRRAPATSSAAGHAFRP
jgi:uncharacterized membrane protein (UPF0127 family)